ncbi:helix-turn-helix domain-containing protein [Nocardia salmonicida]|uniref:helix-turn-helix domain-containing protein n=2 Tax=Nocardia salmonicida TaxID=53431 RepID=UPI0014716278|nr:helix-turn-helix transcriptional regulator [Nocardia salmonicida]
MSAEFWASDHMRDALASWHIGRVIYAWRTHPMHETTIAQLDVANWLDVAQATLSRIETGDAPEALSKLVKWATLLHIPEELLWFRLPRRATVDDVDRQGFLRAAAATAASAIASPSSMLRLLDEARATPIPSRVGPVEIAQIRDAATLFARWDAEYGGALVRDVVTTQLRIAEGYLHADCAPADRADLEFAVGTLAHTSAFVAFDACIHSDATEAFELARKCAKDAGAVHLHAKVLSSMARHAIWTGRIYDGVGHIQEALALAPQLTATERAMLCTTEARVRAKLGDIQGVLTAVGNADEHFTNSSPDNDPVWMHYYDHAQHAGDTGHALFDIAIHGSFVSEARTRLSTAVQGHTDLAARSRTMSSIKLASLVMATGDPDEAKSIGSAALTGANALHSRRAAEDVQELHGYADQAGVRVTATTA